MIDENLRRALKTWADPLSKEQLDASRQRFLEKVAEKPARSRFWGIATVAASLLIAAAVFWSVVSFREVPIAGAPQDLSPVEIAELERLVKQLGVDDPGERQKALDELRKKGRRILPALQKTLARAEDPEIRARIQEIIDFYNRPSFVLSEEPGIPGGAVAWSPDGRELAVLLGTQLKVYDTKSWKLRQSTRLEGKTSFSIAWQPSGKRILVVVGPTHEVLIAGGPFQLVAIDAGDLEKTSVVGSFWPTLTPVAFLDGDRLVFPREDKEPKGLRVATPAQGSWEVRNVYPTDMRLGAFAVSADGKWIGLLGQRIDVVDATTKVRRASLEYPLRGAAAQNPTVDFSPDSRWMVVEGGDGALFVCETSTWKEVATWQPHGKDVSKYQFTHDSRFIVTRGSGNPGSDTTMRAWMVESRREVASVDLPRYAGVAVSPVDDRIVVSFLDDLKTAEKYTMRVYRLKLPE